MGGGYQQSKSSGKQGSESKFVESQLSLEQAKILKNREVQYQEYFFPEIVNQLEEAKTATINNPAFNKTAKAVSAGAETAKGQLAESMARRGITDGGSAIAGELSIEQARGSALAEAYFNSQLSQKSQLNSILQMGGALSPTPTTAAPTGSESSSFGKQKSSSFGVQGSLKG